MLHYVMSICESKNKMEKQCVLFQPAHRAIHELAFFFKKKKKKDKTLGMGGKTSPEILHQGITQFSIHQTDS